MDDKRQITAIFAASCTVEFLPIQLIYARKSILSKYPFPRSFSVRFTRNPFKEIIFPSFEETKQSKRYPLEQHALIIMEFFKGQ